MSRQDSLNSPVMCDSIYSLVHYVLLFIIYGDQQCSTFLESLWHQEYGNVCLQSRGCLYDRYSGFSKWTPKNNEFHDISASR